jgi:outer membrane protein assembly factor BamB
MADLEKPMQLRPAVRILLVFSFALAIHLPSSAADWPTWRGVNADGVSAEAGLPEKWSQEGQNLLWKAPIGGRSTPIVLDGRVCVITLAEPEDATRWQERIVCLDAETGKIRWEHRYNIFQTDIPHHRVGWASLAGDPETGYVYSHGVEGMVICFDRAGKIVWSRSFGEEVGRISGFGGRTVDPILDGDLVIVSFLTAGWGGNFIPRHRYFALDKSSGAIVWISTPGGAPKDTTYSVPVVEVIDGERLLITGNGDGGIYGLQVATGKKAWAFALSKRGINSSVLVNGHHVYASHSEENVDESTAMGRLVHLDASQVAEGKPSEAWKVDGFGAGYASPAYHDGILYHVDNSANLVAFDAATGEQLWLHNIGIAQKGSPIVVDGKIYVADVDGKFHTLKMNGRQPPDVLHVEEFKNPDGSATQINGSPAVADGRVYLMTASDLYAIGGKMPASTPPQASKAVSNEAPAGAVAAQVQVVPAEVIVAPGGSRTFVARTFDAKGRFIGESKAEWSLDGLQGDVSSSGELKLSADSNFQGGMLVASVGGLKGTSRVSARPAVAFTEGFDSYEDKSVPPGWNATRGRFAVAPSENGGKVLKKPSGNRRSWRTTVFFGDPAASGYVVEADVMGAQQGRRKPDIGLVSHRYTLAMMGNRKKLMIRTWLSELIRFSKVIPFEFDTNVWYRMKLRVDVADGGEKATVRGKVWKKSEAEPDEWTIEAEDALPHTHGSPGIYGYSAADISYDNIKVTPAGG